MPQLKHLSDIGEPDYWNTMEGIGSRIEMFGHELEYGTFNNSIRISASAVGIFDMMIVGPTSGGNICEWCAEFVGRTYRSNRGFIPRVPHHPNCRHNWELFYVGEK